MAIIGIKEKRNYITSLVKHSARMTGLFREFYNTLYKRFMKRHHVNLKIRAKNRGQSTIEYATQNGYINELFNLTVELWG